jgi:hypothetical protein
MESVASTSPYGGVTGTSNVVAHDSSKQTSSQSAANDLSPPKVLNSQDQNLFLMLSRDLDT